MSLLITGECLGVTTEQRGKEGQKFTVTTVHVLDGVRTDRVELGKNFIGELPTKGDHVALGVYAFAWKSAVGNVGVELKAHSRITALEAVLAAA